MISILTTRRVASVFSAVALCAVMAGCSLEGQPAPALTGPSEFGLSVIASAIPDQLLRDGASQTVVTMTTRGADGSPMAGQSIAIALASAGSGTVSPHLVKLSADLVTSRCQWSGHVRHHRTAEYVDGGPHHRANESRRDRCQQHCSPQLPGRRVPIESEPAQRVVRGSA